MCLSCVTNHLVAALQSPKGGHMFLISEFYIDQAKRFNIKGCLLPVLKLWLWRAVMKLNAFPVAMSPGTAARSLLELQGEETCLRLETSAKGEDLLTGQAALAVAQKPYIKVKRFIFQTNWGGWCNFQNKDFFSYGINRQKHLWAFSFFCVCCCLLAGTNVIVANAGGGGKNQHSIL